MAKFKLFSKWLVTLFTSLVFALSVSAESGQSEGEQTAPPNNNNSINQNADTGSSESGKASMVNTVVGVGMIGYGVSLMSNPATASYGAVLIMLGGMALSQASADSGAQGQYDGVGGLTDYSNIPGWSPGITTGLDPDGVITGPDGLSLTPSGHKALDDAKKLGYNFDMGKGTMTDPDGNEVPFSDVNASGGAAGSSGSSGFSSGNLAKGKKYANKLAKEALAKYSVGSMGFSGGGGGGGGYGGGGDDASEANDPLADYLSSLNKRKKKRKPASVAGMKKRFGTDVIGVKADNIFEMIHRRYKRKRDNREFIVGPVPRGL